jgi:hypothetical protein
MPPPRAFQINPPLTHKPLLSSVRRESSRSNASKRSDNDTDDDELAMKVFRRSGAPYADFHPFCFATQLAEFDANASVL